MGGTVLTRDEWHALDEDLPERPWNSSSNVLEASHVVKSGRGLLFGFTVYNSGAAQFIQWHDATTLPADGAVPAGFVPIAATTDRELLWIPARTFHSGIVLCNSSTGPTKTIGAADCFFDAQYV